LIRRATLADAPLLAELGSSTFIEAFGHLYAREDLETFLAQAHSEAKYRALLSSPDVAIWIASDERGAPLGYGIAGACGLPVKDLEPRAGEIKRLYVRAAAQGLRIGSRIMDVMLDWLASAGREPLYVGVWSQNPGAQRLYGRYGFEKVSEYDFPVGKQIDREFIFRRRA